MIRNLYKSLAAVPGLIISDVNFAFACFVHNHRILFSANLVSYCFGIIRTPCPIKVWSPGHFVLEGAQKLQCWEITANVQPLNLLSRYACVRVLTVPSGHGANNCKCVTS